MMGGGGDGHLNKSRSQGSCLAGTQASQGGTLLLRGWSPWSFRSQDLAKALYCGEELNEGAWSLCVIFPRQQRGQGRAGEGSLLVTALLLGQSSWGTWGWAPGKFSSAHLPGSRHQPQVPTMRVLPT